MKTHFAPRRTGGLLLPASRWACCPRISRFARAWLLVSTLTLVGVGLAAESDHAEIEPLAPDPAIICLVSPNGLRIHALANNRPSGQITVLLRVPYGAASDSAEHAGLAHLTEHLFFHNRHGSSGQSLAEKLRALGVQDGTGMNAITTPTYTQYEFHLQPEVAEKLPDLFVALGEALSGWAVSSDDYEREVEIVIQEIRTRAGSGLDLARATHAVLFAGTPFEQVDLAGDLESVARIQPSDVADFFQWAYAPQGLLLCIVGDTDAQAAAEVAREQLGEVSSAFATSTDPKAIPSHPVEEPRQAFIQSPGKSSTDIVIAWPLPRREWTHVSHVRSGLAETVGMQILESRLARLRDRNPGILLANAGVQTEEPRLRYLAAAASDLDWRSLLEAIVGVLPPGGEVSPQEIEVALKALHAQIEAPIESAQTPHLATHLIDTLSLGAVPTSDTQMQRLLLDILPSISEEEISAALMGFTRLAEANYVVTLPENIPAGTLPDAQLAELALTAFAASTDTPDANVEVSPFDLPELPNREVGAGMAFVRQEVEGRMLLTATTPNGVEIALLADEELAAERFYLRLAFDGGERTETPDTRGTLSLLAFHLAAGATSDGRSAAFEEWLAEKQLVLGVKAETDALTLSVEGPTDSMLDALRLVHFLLLANEGPHELTCQRWVGMQQMLAASRRADPKSIASDRVRSLLFPTDASALEIPAERLEAVSGAEAASLWAQLRRSADTRLAIVTSETSKAESLLRLGVTALAPLPDRTGVQTPAPHMPDPHSQPRITVAGCHDLDEATLAGAENSEVRLVYAIPASSDPQYRAAAEVRARLVTRRLYRELRENLGLSYEQHARLVPSRRDESSWFLIVAVSCDPANADAVKEKVRAIVEEVEDPANVRSEEWTLAYEDWRQDVRRRIGNPRAWLSELSPRSADLAWLEFLLQVADSSAELSGSVAARINPRVDQSPELLLAIGLHPETKAPLQDL